MNWSNLPENFIDDPERLIREARSRLKKSRRASELEESDNTQSPTPTLSDPDTNQSRLDLSPVFEAMADKTLREFSAPTTANVRTGPEVAIGDHDFELKPGLINMVQASQFCGKAHEDASAHLQHFLEICSTFTIKNVPRDAILLRLFPFSLLGKAKQWFYATKEKNTTWSLCSTAFLAKFFPIGKTNALRGKISNFQQQHDESVPEAWERFQEYISECPHHGMETWLLMQTFYHGLTTSTRETMDAAAGGAFLSLTLSKATDLVEKMASNHSWNEDRQPRKRSGMHQLKEVDMLSAKMDLIMKKLEDRDPEKKEVMQILDSRMTCEECGNTGHTGKNCPDLEEKVNYINNNNNYRPQNQGWNQQTPNYQGKYPGNFQGNNFNNNFNTQPSLRDLVINQGKHMENLSRKLASNDKTLETINNRMDSFSAAIKNQHNFNKMIESQISQLATSVPLTPSGDIPGQPEKVESANLVDIYNAGRYHTDTQMSDWMADFVPKKRGDPGRPVITIQIGPHEFDNTLCDHGSSINVLPKVHYDKINGDPLLYTTMCLQLADQSVIRPKGVLQDVLIRLGRSCVNTDFVVIETGGDERAPIILGRPFLNTAKAIIYTSEAKICFTIKNNKETFKFKNKTLTSPAHPQMPYACDLAPEPQIKQQKKKKNKKAQPMQVMMINKVNTALDYALRSPMLPKLEDPGVPTIACAINKLTFNNTYCDTGSGINLMSKVTYELLFNKMPLHPTYAQLQMADQSYRFPEGIARHVLVQINQHYVPTDFVVMDMGEEEHDPPLVLGRPFLNTTRAIIYVRSGEIHFQFPKEKVRLYFNSYNTYEQKKMNRSARRLQKKKLLRDQRKQEEVEEPATPRRNSSNQKQWRKKETSPSTSSTKTISSGKEVPTTTTSSEETSIESSVPPCVTSDALWE